QLNNYHLSPYPCDAATGRNITGIRDKCLPLTELNRMKSTKVKAGVELGFLNNALTAEVDFFKRSRTGIPTIPNDIAFPLETGLSTLPQNLDSDATMGVDGLIRYHASAGEFQYNLGLNFTLARQQYGKRYGERFFNSWDQYRYAQSDRWSNVSGGSHMWMWEVIGVFQTQEEIDNYPVNIDGANNANLRPGDLIYRDVNNDGIMDEHDERPLGYAAADWPWDASGGNRTPLMTLGFSFGFNWKGIDFATDLAGGFMNTFVMDWQTKWGVDRTSNGYYYNSMDVWRHEDILDPTSPWIPGTFPSIGTVSARWWNDYYTHNVNYLRIRNLALGYTLPHAWTTKAAI